MKKIDTNYLELVHRIDKDTSGILLLAKNKNILCKLHNDFKNRKIKKEYISLVHGYFSKKYCKVENYIYKNKFNKFIFFNINKGKFSKTLFSINKYFKKYTLLSIKPITGRNHQIRLHISSLGYNIVGDKKYGNKYLDKLFFYKFKIIRLFLHSYKLLFIHPYYNKKMYLYAKLDNNFIFILNNLF